MLTKSFACRLGRQGSYGRYLVLHKRIITLFNRRHSPRKDKQIPTR